MLTIDLEPVNKRRKKLTKIRLRKVTIKYNE